MNLEKRRLKRIPSTLSKTEIDKRKFQRLYAKYNRLYFGRSLPRYVVFVLKRSEMPGPEVEGFALHSEKAVLLADGGSLEIMSSTLLHEMVHIAVPDAGHGTEFRAELERLYALGAPLTEKQRRTYLDSAFDVDEMIKHDLENALEIGLDEDRTLKETLHAIRKVSGYKAETVRSIVPDAIDAYIGARRAKRDRTGTKEGE